MTIVAPTQTEWLAAGAPDSILQVFSGRVRLATSATPAAGDHLILPVGAVIELQSVKYVQALDPGAYCVWQVL